MSKLFSCFLPNKKSRDYSPQEGVRRSRVHSRENEIVFVDTSAGNQQRFNGNVRQVYRTETSSQTPEYEKLFGPDKNRQSRSYPVSPERRSLYKVYSFEQRPSVEKQRLVNKRDSNNLMLYTANATVNTPQFNKSPNNSDNFSYEIPVVNLPRRSVLSYGVDYEKEMLSNGRQVCKAEKPAEEYHKPNRSEDKSALPTLGKDNNKFNQENEILSTQRTSKENNEEFLIHASNMENQNLLYLDATEPKIKTVIKSRPQSSKNFRLGGSVKVMTYRAEDVNHSPMSANKYVHQMPMRATKQPPVLTTADGRVLMPLSANTVRKLSTSSDNEKKPVKLSDGGFRLVPGGEAMVAAPMFIGGGKTVGGFPLAQGQEMIVAAPMIGGGGKGRRGGKPSKSILRKEKGGKAQYRNEPEDDYYDDYPDERDYGRGNYRQPYYDDGLDMYASYFAPVDGGYGSRGYYDDGYGYPDEGIGGYRGGPMGGRSARQQVYTSQIPDMTLPVTSDGKGKNPPFKKMGKVLDEPGTSGIAGYRGLTDEKPVDTKIELPKGSKVQLISSGQQTDHENELDFICFSPEGFLKAALPADDPNSKLRWKIIIKRADED